MPDLKRDHVWCIYSRLHNKWHRPQQGLERGYTDNVSEAGRFTLAAALDICEEAGDLDDGRGKSEFPHPAPEYYSRLVIAPRRPQGGA